MDNTLPFDLKKITFFLASMEGGGIQKATLRLMQELIRLGWSPELVAINGKGPLKDEVPIKSNFIDLGVARTRYAFFSMLKFLISHKPLIGVSAQTHLNVLLIILKKLTGYPKRLIVTEHITFTKDHLHHRKLSERIRPTLIYLFYPMASAVVAVSTDAAKSIKKYASYKKNITVIENGLDLDEIRSLTLSSSSGQSIMCTADENMVVGLGRLSLQKNFPLLMDAFSKLDLPKSRLVIMGDGEDKNDLLDLGRKLKIEDRFILPGFVKNPYAVLAKARVFVLSSNWEGFCNVVIEALACGVPIVATDCPGGPGNLLKDQPFARIVPMNDPIAMSVAIKSILESPIDRKNIIEFARQFNISTVAQKYIELVKTLR